MREGAKGSAPLSRSRGAARRKEDAARAILIMATSVCR